MDINNDQIDFTASVGSVARIDGEIAHYVLLPRIRKMIQISIDLPFTIFMTGQFSVELDDMIYPLTFHTISDQSSIPDGTIGFGDASGHIVPRLSRTTKYSYTRAMIYFNHETFHDDLLLILQPDFTTYLYDRAIEVVNKSLIIYADIMKEYHIRPIIKELDCIEFKAEFFDSSNRDNPIYLEYLVGGSQNFLVGPVSLMPEAARLIREAIAKPYNPSPAEHILSAAHYHLAMHDPALALAQGLTAVEVRASQALSSAGMGNIIGMTALRDALSDEASKASRKRKIQGNPINTLEEIQTLIDKFAQNIEGRITRYRPHVGLPDLSTSAPMLYSKFSVAKIARNKAVHAGAKPSMEDAELHLATFIEVFKQL